MTKKVVTKKTAAHFLSRRDTLRLIGVAGASALVAWAGDPAIKFLPRGNGGSVGSVTRASALDCVVRPQQTEGPYFVDEKLNRSDIRTEPTTGVVKAGVPFILQFNVSGLANGNCAPVPGALVDIWHCDAVGSYSDVGTAQGQKFLRGYQVTDANGAARFTTIYPGWYTGRTVHIHFKIRLYSGSQQTYEFTSQLYFDDALTDQVFTQAPYNTRSSRDTRNSRDGIYNGGGSQLLLSPTPSGQGYTATFNIGLEGVTGTPPPASSGKPIITGATVSGKQLIVTGTNFSTGAGLLMNGEKQKKTANDETNPTTMIIARKSAKWIIPGQTVQLQVRNSDDTLSDDFLYTRPQ